ncbi:MAG: hypothetical protein H6574_12540 [Lewinellaceae bacterium]|nr:hypothetical protein [Saprospiraceae bacterium]MCB9317382.1 hypothetical protein [Lewinellaceae bacterium]MCB9331902.1 hypothetical protein [Lewinellaceae bacterium]
MDDNLLFEIMDLLDDGEIVYLHRQTKEILSYPDPQRWSESEFIDLIEEVKARAAAEPDQFVVLDPPDPRDSYHIMEDFVFTVEDEQLRNRLLEALDSKKPFRYFRSTVEDSPLKEAWYDFHDARMKEWVLEMLARVWD